MPDEGGRPHHRRFGLRRCANSFGIGRTPTICAFFSAPQLDRGVFTFFCRERHWVFHSHFPPPLLFPFSLSPSFVWKGEKKRSEKKQSVHAHKRTLTRTASQPWSGRRSGKQREGRDLFFLRRPLFFFFDLINALCRRRQRRWALVALTFALSLALLPRLALRPLSCTRLSMRSRTRVEICD